MTPLAEIERRIDEVPTAYQGVAGVAELVRLGEEILEHWVASRGEMPTRDEREGFRLLALQRQGTKGEPSFNACRETCRELAFHYNLIASQPDHPETAKRLLSASMVAKHLCLFVSGKMEVGRLGEFCCSSRPLRGRGT